MRSSQNKNNQKKTNNTFFSFWLLRTINGNKWINLSVFTNKIKQKQIMVKMFIEWKRMFLSFDNFIFSFFLKWDENWPSQSTIFFSFSFLKIFKKFFIFYWKKLTFCGVFLKEKEIIKICYSFFQISKKSIKKKLTKKWKGRKQILFCFSIFSIFFVWKKIRNNFFYSFKFLFPYFPIK